MISRIFLALALKLNVATKGMSSAIRLASMLAAIVAVLTASVVFVTAQDAAPSETKVRELLVPFEDLPIILNSQTQRVFMTRQEYAELLKQSKKSAEIAPPLAVALVESKYEAVIDDGRATIQGRLTMDVLADGIHAVPLVFSGVGIQSTEVNGQPAAMAINDQGQIVIFVEGKGQKQIAFQMLAPVATAAAQQSLHFQLPVSSATTFSLRVPGNVEIKSGAQVTDRQVDQAQNFTQFGIVAEPRPMSIVMTLNNRSLREQQVVVAKSVLVDEMTLGYERLHANMSMSVLHGAADRYRFVLPVGFEIAEVQSQSLARWQIQEADGKRILEVTLRAPQSEKEGVIEVVQVTAFRPATVGQDWQFPRITPMDVQDNISIVGILAEERIISESIVATGLIPIDNQVLRSALPESIFRAEPSAPAIRPIVAYYAPQTEFDLSTKFQERKVEKRATTNLLLVANERGLEIHGGFSILPISDKLFQVDLSAPVNWHVSSITLADGTALPFEDRILGNERQIRVVFPAATQAGQTQNILVTAHSVPEGWLADWTEQQVEFPRLFLKDMTSDIGACAVQVDDDLVARPSVLNGLTVLNETEKATFQLNEVQTSLAYRYEVQPWSGTFRIERQSSRLTAKSFSFFKIEPEGLSAHYEVNFSIDQASTQRLEFSLPENTPSEVTISGLDGLQVKETSSKVVDGRRVWTVLLASRQKGSARLAVDFQQPIADQEPKDWGLPVIRAENVAFQSGMLAVEGHSELDTEVKTHPRRVDIGELVDAQYKVGRRLLGAFGFIGTDSEIVIDVSRRAGHALPTTIAERMELVSVISKDGLCQTVGRFRLRTKAQFLQAQLPPDSELWSMLLDGQPALPQRDGDRLVVDLPANNAAAYRDLQIVYETKIAPVQMRGEIDLTAIKLLVPFPNFAGVAEVPMADLQWQVYLPNGYQIVQSEGSVFTSIAHQSPIQWLAWLLYEMGGGTVSSVKSSMMPQRLSKRARTDMRVDEYARSIETINGFRSEPLSLETMDSSLASGVAGAMEQNQVVPPPTSQPPVAKPQDAEQLFDLPQLAAPQAPAPQAATKGKAAWALEGLRSLDISLAIPSGNATLFQSFGVDPELRATIVRQDSWLWLAAAVGAAAVGFSLCWLFSSSTFKIRWVAFLVFLGLVLPSATSWTRELEATSQSLFIAAAIATSLYVIIALRNGFSNRNQREGSPSSVVKKAATASLLLAVLLSSSSRVNAQPPVVEKPEEILQLLNALLPDKPITIPEDAVVVPVDANDPLGLAADKKILVPYATYERLWNLAYPDKRLTEKPLPANYALRGATYTSQLNSEDALLVEGRIRIEIFSDKEIVIPLPLAGGVLAGATVDGQPARIAIAQALPIDEKQQAVANQAAASPPTGSLFLLHISGKGLKEFAFSMRFKLERRGGWRVAEGRLPPAPSSQWSLIVPIAGTDIRLRGVTDRLDRATTQDGQRIETALAADGAFGIQWRPKISEANVDQGLTADSIAVLDVQENGLRLAWKTVFEFRRGRRDTFTVEVPKDYFVEKVVGENVRGWVSKSQDNAQLIDVTLLETAVEKETLTFFLAKNQAMGELESSQMDTPVIRVPDAMLQQGTITIRRSRLLEIRADEVKGLSRVDAVDEATLTFVGVGSSPLPLKPFQSYRFAATPFQLKLSVQAIKPKIQVTSQSLLKVSPRELLLESRFLYQVQDRPVHLLRIALPKDYELLAPVVAGNFEWFVKTQTDSQILEIQLADGLIGDFSVVVRGSARRQEGNNQNTSATIPLPRLEALSVDRQQGTIVVQADPSFDIRANQLQNCEVIRLDQAFGWLAEQQRSLARVALEYRQPDYQAQLTVARRPSVVHVIAITNVKVTERALEETVLLDWTIRDSGIRQVAFVLPYWMRDARITAPMTREIIKTPVDNQPNADIRFQIELQDEIINEYRVVLENDRQLVAGEKTAPIPTVETGVTDRRYVTLENAGRDEIVTKQLNAIEPLDRQQNEWRSLSSLLGGKAAQAYLVREGDQPALLTFDTTERTEVETAGARIGLARALLVVDENGAYRGLQEYRVENRTEQYLEIELPNGAEMWTAIVADEPVKPMEVAGSNRLRIPLVKTADGDLDYGVFLKYGGRLESLSTTPQLRFPLIRAINVRAELSQVRLRLPDKFRWYGFSGSMGQVLSEADLTAGWLSFKTKQVQQLTQMLRETANPNAFSKARAAANLRQLGEDLRNQSGQFGREVPDNRELKEQVDFNNSAIKQAEDLLAQQKSELTIAAIQDNRGAIKEFYKGQGLKNSLNVVNSLGGNFDAKPMNESAPAKQPASEFDASGFQNKSFEKADKNLEEGRIVAQSGKEMAGESKKMSVKPQAPDATRLRIAQEGAKPDVGKSEKQLDDINLKVNRYRAELENEQVSRRALARDSGVQQGQPMTSDLFAGQQPSQYQLPPNGPPASFARNAPFGGQSNVWSDDKGQAIPGNALGAIQNNLANDGLSQRVGGFDGGGRMPQSGSGAETFGVSPYGALGAMGTRAGGEPASAQRGLDVAAPRIAGTLASLDVEIPIRGQEFLFTTPGNELELTANGFSTSLAQRLTDIGIAFGILIGTVIVAGVIRAIAKSRNGKLVLTFCLMVAGLVSLVTGTFPVYGLLSLIISVGLFIMLWRTSASARLLPEVK